MPSHSQHQKTNRWGRRAGALALIVATTLLGWMAPVAANGNTHGLPQVEINPGGGTAVDGLDGVRFVLNGHVDQGAPAEGSDQIHYKNTTQYCCDGSGPMLNIGGTLYGETGPAVVTLADSWSNVEIVSTSGSATTDPTSTAVGSGTATLRYTVNHNGLDYVVERTVTYNHPSSFVTEDYRFTIPAGNTEVVTFYRGGDGSPGGSRDAVGVLAAELARTIYSVSADSGFQIGYGALPGAAPFDGAFAHRYGLSFVPIHTSWTMGWAVENQTHDSWMAIRWTLPTAPGTYNRAHRHLVEDRGVSLAVSPRSSEVDWGESVLLDLVIVNTDSSTKGGLGYTYQLPADTVVGTGSIENSCGGTVTAVPGSSTIQMSAASITSSRNCVTSVPVVVSSTGTVVFSSNAVQAPAGDLLRGVATHLLLVNGGPDVGDGGSPDVGDGGSPDLGVCPALHGWDVIGDQVERLYQTLLGRAADVDGLIYWTQARLSGLSARELATLILDSPERHADFVDAGDEDFVDRLYRDGLDGAVDTAGRAHWLDQLRDGVSRAEVALAFSDSASSVAHSATLSPMTDSEATVCRLYRTLFDRSPEEGGFAYWTRLLDGGLAPWRATEAMLTMAEAHGLSQSEDEEFIDHLYRHGAIQRPADQSGRQHWTEQAQARGRGWTAHQIINRLESLSR